MSQLLAGGLIALGLIFGILVFILSKEKTAQLNTAKAKIATPPEPMHTVQQQQEVQRETVFARTINETTTTLAPIVAVAGSGKDDLLSAGEQATPITSLHNSASLPSWWHEQFQSLTVQLRHLREHAKDVEQQIAILSEIARLAAELEAIQSKHIVLSGDRPLQFPRRVSRETMDGAYLTDKRPAMRKYTIKAM